jgi:hypothetical protein
MPYSTDVPHAVCIISVPVEAAAIADSVAMPAAALPAAAAAEEEPETRGSLFIKGCLCILAIVLPAVFFVKALLPN